MSSCSPTNIFDYMGKKLPTKRTGGWVMALLRPVGGGWDIVEYIPPGKEDKSDRMLGMRYVRENIDIWEACRDLNERATIFSGRKEQADE